MVVSKLAIYIILMVMGGHGITESPKKEGYKKYFYAIIGSLMLILGIVAICLNL